MDRVTQLYIETALSRKGIDAKKLNDDQLNAIESLYNMFGYRMDAVYKSYCWVIEASKKSSKWYDRYQFILTDPTDKRRAMSHLKLEYNIGKDEVPLDGSVDINEIYRLIDNSYTLSLGK